MEIPNGISKGESLVKGGKLIRVRVEFQGNRIKEIRITGDFFLHPEDKIEDIENGLKNVPIDEVRKKLDEILKDAEYLGFTLDTLVQAVEEAWKRRKQI